MYSNRISDIHPAALQVHGGVSPSEFVVERHHPASVQITRRRRRRKHSTSFFPPRSLANDSTFSSVRLHEPANMSRVRNCETRVKERRAELAKLQAQWDGLLRQPGIHRPIPQTPESARKLESDIMALQSEIDRIERRVAGSNAAQKQLEVAAEEYRAVTEQVAEMTQRLHRTLKQQEAEIEKKRKEKTVPVSLTEVGLGMIISRVRKSSLLAAPLSAVRAEQLSAVADFLSTNPHAKVLLERTAEIAKHAGVELKAIDLATTESQRQLLQVAYDRGIFAPFYANVGELKDLVLRNVPSLTPETFGSIQSTIFEWSPRPFFDSAVTRAGELLASAAPYLGGSTTGTAAEIVSSQAAQTGGYLSGAGNYLSGLASSTGSYLGGLASSAGNALSALPYADFVAQQASSLASHASNVAQITADTAKSFATGTVATTVIGGVTGLTAGAIATGGAVVAGTVAAGGYIWVRRLKQQLAEMQALMKDQQALRDRITQLQVNVEVQRASHQRKYRETVEDANHRLSGLQTRNHALRTQLQGERIALAKCQGAKSTTVIL